MDKLAELKRKLEEVKKAEAEAKSADPFWWYEPSDGTISEDGRKLMSEFLKPEDIPEGSLQSQKDVHLSTAEIVLDAGGNQGGKCLTYHTLIDVPGGEIEIGFLYDLGIDFNVYAWDGEKKVVVKASAPFKKPGLHKCYRIVMSDGRVIEAADHHRVLTSQGWISVEQLQASFYSLRETSLVYAPIAPVSGGQRSIRTKRGYQGSCSESSRLGGGLPHLGEDIGKASFPLQVGVLQRRVVLSQTGGQGYKRKHTPFGFSDHPSNWGVFPRSVGQFFEKLSRIVGSILSPFLPGFQLFQKRAIVEASGSLQDHGVGQHQSIVSAYTPPMVVNKVAYITPITACQEVYDFEVPVYHNYCAGGLVHHNTTAGCIEAYITATGELPYSLKDIYPKEKLPTGEIQNVRVVGVDHQTFLRNVLPNYKYWVPREYLKNGKWEDSYNSEGRVLTLSKNGKVTGTIEFMTNQQDVESFQGPPRQKVIYDEEPRYEIYKENLMRFTTAKRLNILFCMTPTKGLSWVKDAILDKGETEDGKSIACFKVPSITNKKANLQVIREILRGLGSYEEIKMRLLGEFVSLSGLVYGNRFNPKIHVIEPFQIKKTEHLVVRGIDPHLVKPSACVELAVDREGNKYVIGCYLKDADTEELKKDLAARVRERKWRLGWSIFDKSSDSTIRVFGDRNIYLEMTRGKDAVPAAFKSDKFTGSINAGVDEIKKDLKVDERTGKPRLFFFNTPEVKPLIQAMQSIERDTYANEDEKGKKDRIKEGKWDLHACLRYIYQRTVRWLPPQDEVVEPIQERYI